MKTILIQPTTEAELKLIQDFLREHNFKSRVLSEENKEDIVLSKMMEETDYADVVNTADFLQQLRS